MTLDVFETNQFKRDSKRVVKQGKPFDELLAVIETLTEEKSLSEKYRDHSLTGNWKGYRECHIKPDWLLIYKIELEALFLARTGSHAELF